MRESERDREKESLVWNSFINSGNNSNNLSPPPFLLSTILQLTNMKRWDTEFVEDWAFCSSVGMVEWFLVLQKKEEVFGV